MMYDIIIKAKTSLKLNKEVNLEVMNIIIPRYVNTILNMLKTSGYQAFIVGGSVRDAILGKIPYDYDVTTSATPDEIKDVFKDFKTWDIGKEFGTIVIVQYEGNVEITTFRTEDVYIDGRRPSGVSFSKDIKEDLSRRDFTINAMAYNVDEGLIDPYNGLKDLENKLIKAVGNPMERFEEDHLRILRAVRFATRLGFRIDNDTKIACKELSYKLSNISVERIRDEFFKLIIAKRPSYGIRLMYDLGILQYIIPELIITVGYDQKNPHHEYPLFDHIVCVLDNVEPDLNIRMAALLHDIAKPRTFSLDEDNVGHYYGHDRQGAQMTKTILKRLRCSNEFIGEVSILVREHMFFRNTKDKGIKKQLDRVGENLIFKIIELMKADRMCKKVNADMAPVLLREKQIIRILESNEPYKKSNLKINGDDIITLGYHGKKVGEILDDLLDVVIKNPEYNKKVILLKIIEQKKY